MRLYNLLTTQCDARHIDLNKKVWSPTPYILNAKTGSEATEEGLETWYNMRHWLINNFGKESYPIFDEVGHWHRGSATVDGWTWIGFSTVERRESFMQAFPGLTTLNTPERHSLDTHNPPRD